jgi:hypothetical protein
MSAREHPSPLVPADLDLRDFRWMRLDLIALFNSDFNSLADDAAWRAGVTLWGRAWHQVPAGSLPDDDALLCNLAGFGRDLKKWAKIRSAALHGFVLCNDGRLYHRFLCAMAEAAASERAKFAQRKAADRERKQRAKPSAGIPRNSKLKGAKLRPSDSHPKTNSESRAAHDDEESPKTGGSPVERLTPPKAPGLRANIKEQLRQKLMRYCNERLRDADRAVAIRGLMGEDAEHDAQWWLDQVDKRRKRERWDDTRAWKQMHLGVRVA